MTNNDAWLKVLEQRVEELKTKEANHKRHISVVIDEFRKWAAEADELEIYYNADFKAQRVVEARETYKAVWARFKKAESELEEYKETMGF